MNCMDALPESFNHFVSELVQKLQQAEILPFRHFHAETLASVMILFSSDRCGEPHLLVIKRSELVDTHKGQYAFPGGVSDLEDGEGDLFKRQTALRETYEEVGIEPDSIEVIGELAEITTPTGFKITPVVGSLKFLLEDVTFKLQTTEVDKVIWIPWKQVEESVIAPPRYEFMFREDSEEHLIWGVTGAMLSMLKSV